MYYPTATLNCANVLCTVHMYIYICANIVCTVHVPVPCLVYIYYLALEKTTSNTSEDNPSASVGLAAKSTVS